MKKNLIAVKGTVNDCRRTLQAAKTCQEWGLPLSYAPTLRQVLDALCERDVLRAMVDDAVFEHTVWRAVR